MRAAWTIRPQVTVIYGGDLDYTVMKRDFPDVHFVYEGDSFSRTVFDVVEGQSAQFMSFCTDDLIYIRTVEAGAICDRIATQDKLLGVSLRLGDHIDGAPEEDCWDWLSRKSHACGDSWGYPFELMGMIYHRAAVDEVMDEGKRLGGIRNPNHLEMIGYSTNALHQWPLMRKFSECRVVGMAVNNVQEEFQGNIPPPRQYSLDYLDDLYEQGKRLNWTAAYGVRPDWVDIGARCWDVQDADPTAPGQIL